MELSTQEIRQLIAGLRRGQHHINIFSATFSEWGALIRKLEAELKKRGELL